MNNKVLIACTLTDAELRSRRETFLRETAKSIVGVEELENGYRYLFPAEDLVLQELIYIVNLERKCCPFIDFALVIKGQSRYFSLELTGQDGAKEAIESLFNWN